MSFYTLNFNLYMTALKICQISLFLLLGLDLKQQSGDTLLKSMCVYVCNVYVKHLWQVFMMMSGLKL